MRARMVGYLGVVVVWVALASFPWASHAAVTIGHTGGNDTDFCDSNSVLNQSASPAGSASYAVPAGGGVITAWSIQGYDVQSSLRLKVWRGGSPALVVGQSALRTVTPNTLHIFPVSPGIPVAAGDTLGLAMPPIVISGYEQRCLESFSPGGYGISQDYGDVPPGMMKNFSFSAGGRRLNVAATVEPDVDADGLGDESQDPCPTVAGTACPSEQPVDPPADVTPPTLENVFIRPTAFRVARQRSARSSARTGTTFGYTLSEAASVGFTIERLSKGRRVKGRCVKPKGRNRRRKACTRARPLGSFVRQSGAGANSQRFSGKIGQKRLKRGRYRATLEAVDASSNASLPRRIGFRVLKPNHKRRR